VRTAADADTLEGGRQATRALASTGYDPTAIICVNGHHCPLAHCRSCATAGLRVPQDVSVTGFDNVKLSEFLLPTLTTVHIPREHHWAHICDASDPHHGRAVDDRAGGDHSSRSSCCAIQPAR